MKKLLLATAIATIAVGAAQAGDRYAVTSSISKTDPALQFSTLGGPVDLLAPGCVSTTNPPNLSISGFAYDDNSDGVIDRSNVNFTGQVEFDSSCGGGGPLVRLTFALAGGLYGATGVTFTDGSVQVDVYTTTSGWVPYGTVDARAPNVPFVSGLTGVCGNTAGLSFPLAGPPYVVTLPGTGCAANTSLSTLTVFGSTADVQANGSVTLTPYP